VCPREQLDSISGCCLKGDQYSCKTCVCSCTLLARFCRADEQTFRKQQRDVSMDTTCVLRHGGLGCSCVVDNTKC